MRTLFEISKSGLRASERSLSVTSGNIINADTPGYTRQRLDRSPNGVQMSGHHSGLGVNIENLSRLRNDMNDVLINQKRQDMAYLHYKAEGFEQLESSMVSDTGLDLDLSISRLFDSFLDLSTDPQDLSVRNSLVSEARQMGDKFADIVRNIDRTSDLTMDSAFHTINKVNNLLVEVNKLNKTIAQSSGAGNPDHSSLDIRVRKLEELSELINFEVTEIEHGAVELRVGGIKVVGVDEIEQLKAEVNDVNKRFNIRIGNGKALNITSGQLGGELDMYQNEIPELRDRLDKLVETIVREVNAVHQQGFGLQDDVQRAFFDPNSTAEDLKLNPELISDPNNIAASTNDAEAGNGELASRMASLRDERLIDGRKLVEYSIDLISTPGSKLQSLRHREEARDAEINMLKTQQERESGVNVDEELSLMIQFQNAYQGAARVMQAAQKMYDTLINMV